MSKFIKNMISSSNEVSHKRVISLVSLVVLIVMVGLKAYGLQIDTTLIGVFASLCGGSSILTVAEKLIPNQE